MRGGYGPGACPFVGPPWDPVRGGNYFAKGTPIGVGGNPPFFGTAAASPQTSQPFFRFAQRGGKRRTMKAGRRKSYKGGNYMSCPKCDKTDLSNESVPNPNTWLPQPAVNAYRQVTGGLGDAALQYQGLAPNPSPLPSVQEQWQL